MEIFDNQSAAFNNVPIKTEPIDEPDEPAEDRDLEIGIVKEEPLDAEPIDASVNRICQPVIRTLPESDRYGNGDSADPPEELEYAEVIDWKKRICPKCEEPVLFITPRRLMEHFLIEHCTYKCNDCVFKTNCYKAAREHARRIHSSSIVNCNFGVCFTILGGYVPGMSKLIRRMFHRNKSNKMERELTAEDLGRDLADRIKKEFKEEIKEEIDG